MVPTTVKGTGSMLSTQARTVARYWVQADGPQAVARARSRSTAAAVGARLVEVGWTAPVVAAVLTAWVRDNA